MDPFRLADAVIHDYRSYLDASFPIQDAKLSRLLTEKIEQEHLLWKGPYIGLTPDYRTGKTPAEVRAQRDQTIGLDARAVARFPGWTLHVHQVKAIERLIGPDPDSTLVATGTGSGKTEAFFLPLLDHCLRARDRGERGVKALILYPLTALTNDQFARFLKYLDGTGVTIARYTSETQREKSQRKKGVPDYVRATREEIWENPPDILMCHPKMLEFLLTRPEDREAIFEGAPLRWLVVDEVHTCTGTFGAELALLIRRLRAVTRRPGDKDLVCVGTSATLQRDSHTGQVPKAAFEELCRFATNLFGTWFGGEAKQWKEAVVVEELADPPAAVGNVLPAMNLSAAELATLLSEKTGPVISAVQRLLGVTLKPDRLDHDLSVQLERHPIIVWLRKTLRRPSTVAELTESWKREVQGRASQSSEEAEREIQAWLLLGARARRDDRPSETEGAHVLRPRLHLFMRGLQHLRRCTNPDCAVLVERGQTSCGACGSKTRALKICRHCGQDFFGMRSPGRVPIQGDHVVPFLDEDERDDEKEDDDESGSGADPTELKEGEWQDEPVHMAWQLHLYRGSVSLDEKKAAAKAKDEDIEEDADTEDPGLGQRRVPLRRFWYCPACGHGRLGTHPGRCNNRKCGRAELVPALAFAGRPIVCPACAGRYGTKDVITPMATGAAAAVTAITSSIVEHLDPQWRRVLVFTDSRQEAAFAAGYLEDKHAGFLRRQVVMQELSHRGEMPLTHAATYVLDRMIDRHLVDPPANKEERRDRTDAMTWELLVEFARRTNRRVNLEGLGVVRVKYADLEKVSTTSRDAAEIKERLNIDDVTCKRLFGSFLDEMRTRRAVDHPFLSQYLSPDNETVRRLDLTIAAFEKRPVGYIDGVGPHPGKADQGKPYARRGWWPAKGSKGVFERLVLELMPPATNDKDEKDQLRRAREVIALIAKALSQPGLSLVPFLSKVDIGSPKEKQPAWMVNHKRIVLVPTGSQGTHVCNTCRTVMGYHGSGRCVQYLCKGSIVALKADPDNYYVQKYTSAEPVALRTAEHSGQIDGAVRADLEKDFNEGRIQALVCTPTMELGVDIQDLAALVLRNVPPQAGNYAQRAGRAGRGGARMGLIVTYCAITPHDQHFYDSPEKVIRGVIQPPHIEPANRSLIARHARALALEHVTTTKDKRLQVPATLRRWLVKSDSMYILSLDGPLSQAIFQAAPKIIERAKEVFETDRKRLDLTWLDEVLDDVIPKTGEAIHAALQQVVDELNILEARLRELHQEGPAAYEGAKHREMRQLQARSLFIFGSEVPKTDGRRDRSLYPLGYLGDKGVLPGYALPGVQVRCFTDRTIAPLQRNAEIGIAEYAPGNTIYVGGRKLVVVGLFGGFDPTSSPGASGRAERGSVPFRRCTRCDVVVLRTDRGTCEFCGEALTGERRFTNLRATRARADVHITSREEGRAHDRYMISIMIADRNDRWQTFAHKLIERPPFTLRHYPQIPIYILNEGHKIRTGDDSTVKLFEICPECGLAKQPDATDPKRITEIHSRSKCTGQFEAIELAAEVRAEALIISIPTHALHANWTDLQLIGGDDPERLRAAYTFDEEDSTVIEPKAAGLAVRELLLAGAKERLAAQEGELRGFERMIFAGSEDGEGEPKLKAVEVVLYDATPGGSGLIGRLVRELSFIADQGRARLSECTCNALARSCYGCLRRYANQRSHESLDRRLSIAFARRLALTSIDSELDVRPDPATATATAPPLSAAPLSPLAGSAQPISQDRKAMELRYRELFISSGIPVRFRDPESQDLVTRGYPVGSDPAQWPDAKVLIEQHRIELPEGNYTIADFALPGQKFAIYCDGGAYHSPANADTNWKHDLAVSNDLQEEGWMVPRFTWDDVEDAEKAKKVVQRVRKRL